MKELLQLLIEACNYEEQNCWGSRWHEIIALKDALESELDQRRLKVIR